MKLRRKVNRREALAYLGAAPLALPAVLEGGARVEQAVWVAVPCPGCEQDVCFLPDQRRNRCAWCGRTVRRGMG